MRRVAYYGLVLAVGGGYWQLGGWGAEVVAKQGPFLSWFLLAVLLIGGMALTLGIRRKSPREDEEWAGLSHHELLGAILFLIPLLLLPHRGGDVNHLPEQFSHTMQFHDVTQEEEWYRAHPLHAKIPYEMLNYLRRGLPPHRLLAAPYDWSQLVTALTPQYVICSGTANIQHPSFLEGVHRVRNPGEPWPGYLAFVMDFVGHMAKVNYEWRPLFNPEESLETTKHYLLELTPEYILIPPGMRDHYERMNAATPGILTPEFEANQVSLRAVHLDVLKRNK
jgi:hypothetical protein